MSAIYAVYTSPNHAPIPNHLPTLIVTPHGQPNNILYSYLHTNFNSENYLLTPSPQGDLCVAKLYPPRQGGTTKSSASDPGHGSAGAGGTKVVKCEASRNLKWEITNTGIVSPNYKLTLPSPNPDAGPPAPLFQISKPGQHDPWWTMFYFAYAGHMVPPRRIPFGRIQKNADGQGTRITISGQSQEEKDVWQTLGEGNEDCVEWVVLCAALNLLDDEILKVAAEKAPPPSAMAAPMPKQPPPNVQRPAPVPQQHHQGPRPPPQQQQQQQQQQQHQHQQRPPMPPQQPPVRKQSYGPGPQVQQPPPRQPPPPGQGGPPVGYQAGYQQQPPPPNQYQQRPPPNQYQQPPPAGYQQGYQGPPPQQYQNMQQQQRTNGPVLQRPGAPPQQQRGRF